MGVSIVAEREDYLLVSRGDYPWSDRWFAVLERRAGRLYNCHCGCRGSVPTGDLAAVPTILDEGDWADLATARAALDEAAQRWCHLAECML